MTAAIDEVLVEASAAGLRAALLAGGELLEVVHEPLTARGATGSIYVGRVVRAAPALRAVFVEIGLERPSLLDVDGDAPAEGSGLPVQIIEAAAGDKAARVSRRIALEGRYGVLLPGGKGAAVSRAVTAEAQKRRLQKLAVRLKGPGEGLILRAAAAGADYDPLEADVLSLRARWAEIKSRLAAATPPVCVFDNGDGVVRLLRRAVSAKFPRFVVDDPLLMQRLRGAATRLFGSAPDIAVEARGAPMRSHAIDDILATTEMKELPLPSGGRMFVETTAAVIAVDVDTAGGHDSGAALTANLEAAAEIGRQVRLRDLGGIIVVDFVRLKDKGQRARVEAALRRAVALDRISVHVLGWTKGGLFEMIRARTRAVANLE